MKNHQEAKCWWYDPSCGKTISIGVFKTSGYHSFTPDSENDWVLVVDNVAANLPEPGK